MQFEVKGDTRSDNLEHILRMCDQAADILMEAVDKLEHTMQMKVFTYTRSGDDEADEAFWKILDDVLQGGLMRAFERYREKAMLYSMKYGKTKDDTDISVWLTVCRKEDDEDKASLEVVPEEEEPTH